MLLDELDAPVDKLRVLISRCLMHSLGETSDTAENVVGALAYSRRDSESHMIDQVSSFLPTPSDAPFPLLFVSIRSCFLFLLFVCLTFNVCVVEYPCVVC